MGVSESGRALVVLATLGFPDRDGDLILPNSLANERAVVSSGEHRVLHGQEPVGEARLFEKDGRLWGDVTWYPDDIQ
jgi:hypothetical protein